jgi:hypothetical protein
LCCAQYVEFRQDLLSSSIWSTSASSNYYTQDASLSAWGTTVTPTFGPYHGTKTGVSGY